MPSCEWANMIIRIDKCSSFGMTKIRSVYAQTKPCLFIESVKIPPTSLGSDFTYLGKLFNFDLNNNTAKQRVLDKLKNLLQVTSALKCKVQLKLKIIRLYVHSQLLFELKIYSFPVTWIDRNLDLLCVSSIRSWTEQPISSCVKESSFLPKKHCGLGIPTIKSLAEKSRLLKRNSLKESTDDNMRCIWEASSAQNVESDSLLIHNKSIIHAQRALKAKQCTSASDHFLNLPSQGVAAKTVIACVPKVNILLWSSVLEAVVSFLHNFALKAIKQQLPTSSNLSRWKMKSNPKCMLCLNQDQTNKHVLSNCSSSAAPGRYTTRHNSVLLLVANWLKSVIASDQAMFVDLPGHQFNSPDMLFSNLRPDIAVTVNKSTLFILQLTVCHESNLEKSREYKLNKYKDIKSDIRPEFSSMSVQLFTLKVSALGFISDTKDFTLLTKIPQLPTTIKRNIIQSVLNHSYWIYCNRNSPVDIFPVCDVKST